MLNIVHPTGSIHFTLVKFGPYFRMWFKDGDPIAYETATELVVMRGHATELSLVDGGCSLARDARLQPKIFRERLRTLLNDYAPVCVTDHTFSS